MDVKVSIIVPVYNVEKQLDRCVESLLNQTYKDIEIVLVDDGSPDNCPRMCDKYAQADSRVIVIHKENGGLPDARNVGLAVATGKYILFVDSDDWIEKETVEKLTAVIEEQKVDFVRFRAVLDGRKGIPDGSPYRYEPSQKMASGLYDKERIAKEILPRLLITPDLFLGPVLSVCFGLYRKEFFDKNGISFDKSIKYSEDSVFSARVVFAAESFVVLDDAFYHYCFNLSSISFGKHDDWWEVAKLRSDYYAKYFADCDKYDFSIQLKRMMIFNVLDGLSEWKLCDTDSQKLAEIRLVMHDEFTKKAMSSIGLCKVPFKKKIMLYMIKYKMVKLYFNIFNKKD